MAQRVKKKFFKILPWSVVVLMVFALAIGLYNIALAANFDTATITDDSPTVAKAGASFSMLKIVVQDADAGNLESIVVDGGGTAVEADVDRVLLYLDDGGAGTCNTADNGTFDMGTDTLIGYSGATGGGTAAVDGTPQVTFDKDNTDGSAGAGDISVVCPLANSETYFIVYELNGTPTDTNTVTAQILAGNIGESNSVDSGPAANSPTATVTIDTTPPTVTTGCISVTGATGTLGAFKNGDAAVPTWNNSNPGGGCTDANTDVASVSFDASSFRAGDTALVGGAAANVWTASLSGAMDSQDDANNNITVTVTDNAGNVTVQAGTNNYTIDTIIPKISCINERSKFIIHGRKIISVITTARIFGIKVRVISCIWVTA